MLVLILYFEVSRMSRHISYDNDSQKMESEKIEWNDEYNENEENDENKVIQNIQDFEFEESDENENSEMV